MRLGFSMLFCLNKPFNRLVKYLSKINLNAEHVEIVDVHIHDNFGENDPHLGIGYRNINWRRFVNTLKKINYEGALVIESVRNIEESIRRLKNLLES